MSGFPMFAESQLEEIARILGEEVTGSQLTAIFAACKIVDTYDEKGTKWRRIYHSLLERQRKDRCGNNIAAFVQAVMSPVRFRGKSDQFESVRRDLNIVLAFVGLELTPEAEFRRVKVARTIGEAEKRAQILKEKLYGRKVHPIIWQFCKAELLQENYFHAVFEATKSLAQKIRELSGLQSDGLALIDQAFSQNNPRIAFSRLETETERSEHRGFAMLLKGCFAAVRNPLAHEPKIFWKGEDDAADYLTLISLLHRKLDDAIPVPGAKGST